jgi:hypothetical protein
VAAVGEKKRPQEALFSPTDDSAGQGDYKRKARSRPNAFLYFQLRNKVMCKSQFLNRPFSLFSLPENYVYDAKIKREI